MSKDIINEVAAGALSLPICDVYDAAVLPREHLLQTAAASAQVPGCGELSMEHLAKVAIPCTTEFVGIPVYDSYQAWKT